MAPSKRASIAQEGVAKKKRVGTLAKEVATAIRETSTLPDSCGEMLASSVKPTLEIFASERHTYQAQIVTMAAETLKGIKTSLEDELAQAQVIVNSADSEKAKRADNEAKAVAEHAKLEQAAQSAKLAQEASVAAEVDAKASLKAAEKSITESHAQAIAEEEKKGRLETAMTSAYEPFLTSKAAGQEGRKLTNSLEKAVIECGCEEPLAGYLAETLKKDPEARGTFDEVVIKAVNARKAGWATSCDAAIAAAQKAEADATSRKAAAEAAVAAATEALPTSKAAWEAADTAEKEAKQAMKVAKASVATYDSDMKAAATSLEKTQKALDSFLEGPMKSFDELKNLEPPPEPVVPEPVAEPAAVPAQTE